MSTHRPRPFRLLGLAVAPVLTGMLLAACGSDPQTSRATTVPAESTSTSVAETASTSPSTTTVDTSTSLAPTTTAKPKPKPGATTTTSTTPAVTINIPIVTIQLKPSITLLTGPPAQTCAQLAGANGKVKIYFDSKLADRVELKTAFAIETGGTGGWVYFTPPTCTSFAVTATAKSGYITGSSKTIVVTLNP